MSAVPVEEMSRKERKRLKTKDDLLVAAQELFLEKGVDAVTINQITEKADIGLGTFYNYFKSKGDIVDGLSESVAHVYHKEVDAITEGMEDPAEIVAASIKHTFTKAAPENNWGKLMFDRGAPIERITANIQQRALTDLMRGIDAGRFVAEDPAVIIAMQTGSFLAVSHAIYTGILPKESSITCVKTMLELLGISKEEAAEIASRPLKKIKTQDLPVSLLD